MKCINDLIGKPHKTINIPYGCPQVLMQQPDGCGKRSAVSFCDSPAALFAYLVKNMNHTKYI
jgi:hypothetical protein